jgi:tetratricopeptide (TPR) repeat protein
MPLIDAKCPNCGAVLKVERSLEAAICEYCKSAFIIEKAINHYHNTYNVSVKDSVVHIHSEEQIETLLDRADAFWGMREYDNALNIYHNVSEKFPRDPRGWWGLAECYSIDCTISDINKIKTYYERAYALSSPDKRANLTAKYNSIMMRLYKKELSNINRNIDDNRSQLNILMDTRSKAKRGRKARLIFGIIFTVSPIFATMTEPPLELYLLPVALVLCAIGIPMLRKLKNSDCSKRELNSLDSRITSMNRDLSSLNADKGRYESYIAAGKAI